MHYTHHDLRVTEEATARYQYSMDYKHYGAQEMAQALVTPIIYSFSYVPRPACRGSASLYVPPLNYKREGTRHYKTRSQTHLDAHLDPAQTHKFIQALELTDSIQHTVE
jgi:hypothetical protein